MEHERQAVSHSFSWGFAAGFQCESSVCRWFNPVDGGSSSALYSALPISSLYTSNNQIVFSSFFQTCSVSQMLGSDDAEGNLLQSSGL
jgi:hypothetical protein